MKVSSIVLTVLILALTIPNSSSITACPTTDPLNQVYCSCNLLRFSIAGKCIFPQPPCLGTYLTYIYSEDESTKRFNLWNNVIGPFWNSKFTQARKTQTPPNPLPSFLNQFNFVTMTDDQKRGWTQAYYLYLSSITQIQSLSTASQNSLLFDAVNIVQSKFSSLNYIQIWGQLNSFYNSKFSKSLTLAQFTKLTEDRVKKLIPCHQCEANLGPLVTTDSSICKLCPTNCKRCSQDITVCQTCVEGFYLNQLTCVKCVKAGCATCKADGTCLTCVDGKSLVDGNCQDCSDDCKLCQDQLPEVCTQCNTLRYGETPTFQGVCVACTQYQCTRCDAENPGYCMVCGAGYYADDLGVCQKCTSNCIGCNKNECYSCDYGYGLINKVCVQCANKGCLICDNDANVCSQCFTPSFVMNSSNLCQISTATQRQCRPGCQICYEDTQRCFTCSKNYYIENNKCIRCSTGCQQCVDAATCSSCIAGYVLINNKCQACSSNCKVCSASDKTVCQQCLQRYTYVNNTCVLTTQTHCLFFDQPPNESKCLFCKPGYSISTEGICVRCTVDDIWGCNPKNISQSKETRFELNQWYFNQYNLGYQGCEIQVNGQCLKPDERYKIIQVNGTYYGSYKCLYPCTTCNQIELNNCTACETGYSLVNGLCKPTLTCNPNCVQCPSGSARNTITNVCQLCATQNCATCKDGKCIECFEGYYFNGTVCIRCSIKCKTCFNADVCDQCQRGYVKAAQWTSLDGEGQCMKCNPECLTCRFEQSICTSCATNRLLEDNRCLGPKKLKFQSILPFNASQFNNKNQKQAYLEFLAKQVFQKDSSYFFIEEIIPQNDGTVQIKGFVTAQNDTDAAGLRDTIINKSKQNNITTTIDIIDTIAANNNGTGVKVGQNIEQAGPLYWIWIVAGVILGIITITTIFWAIYKYKKMKKQKELEGAGVPSSGISDIQGGQTDQYIQRGAATL